MAATTEKHAPSATTPLRDAVTPRSLLLFFASLFLLNLLLRAFYLRYQFVNGDEGIRALSASGLLDGARLYADVVTDKPPGTTLFYAAVFALFGRSMPAVHLAAAVWNFCTSILVFKTASLVYGRRAGLLAALLFVYFSTNYFTQDMMAANTELLMVLPYTASFYLYLRAALPHRARRGTGKGLASEPVSGADSEPGSSVDDAGEGAMSWRASLYLLGAGLLTGFAVLFKQLGGFNVFFFVACEVLLLYRDWGKRRVIGLLLRSCTRLSLLACGVLLVFGSLALWLYLSGTLKAFWRYAYVLNTFYVDSLSADLWLKFMVKRIFGYVGFNLALWTLAGWTTWQLCKRTQRGGGRSSRSADVNAQVAVLLWGLVSLAAVFTSGRLFGHYFIQVLPALSILAARSLASLIEGWRIAAERRKARFATAILLAFFLFGFVRIHHRTAILAFETLTETRTRFSARWGMSKREREAETVSAALLERVRPGEFLYVWDYALDIYWRTGCRPATRFLTPNHLTGDFTDAEISEDMGQGDFWKQNRQLLLQDLRQNRPRLIVDPTGGIETLPYAEVVEFLRQHYERDAQLGIEPSRPFVLYRLKGA